MKTKLLSYSAVASAMVGGSNTNASVIYTNIDPDIALVDSGDYYDINMDAAGSTDFIISLMEQSAAGPYSFTGTCSWATYLGFNKIGIGGYQISNQAIASLSSGYVLALDYGYSITQNNTLFKFSSPGTGNNIGNYSWAIGCYTVSNQSSSLGFNGYWNNVVDKYIGVTFNINANKHYGWIRVSVPQGYGIIEIKDFAYESAPNVAILAGDTGTANGVIEKELSNILMYESDNIIYVSGTKGTVTIHNSLGQQINVVNYTGKVAVPINNSGVYFIRVESENEVLVRKIILTN
ncbi:MAG: T9SS type A sorting domain-containing protein [Bacteroidetes bacterium]|nr:T9SS type A sorting domain-containing protein [Bacteroidota bacterium]